VDARVHVCGQARRRATVVAFSGAGATHDRPGAASRGVTSQVPKTSRPSLKLCVNVLIAGSPPAAAALLPLLSAAAAASPALREVL
jgi:hypothetical protein